ncbi:MAG: hypothetical protein ACOY9Y_01880 [Bacillota bacterium]
MFHYYEPLYTMYPDLYYRIYPIVRRVCATYDDPANPEMYPYPTRAAVYRMADHVYSQIVGDSDIIRTLEGIDLRQNGGRQLLQSILILLIHELLRWR